MVVDQSSSIVDNKTNAWNAGPLKHVIPTANHERFLIKISLQAPVRESPRLRAGDKVVASSHTHVEVVTTVHLSKERRSGTTWELVAVYSVVASRSSRMW